MSWDFPASPTTGQTFSPQAGTTYTWNGYAWNLQVAGGVPATALRVFTSSTTYVPTAGTAYAIVECIGGGGGGGGIAGGAYAGTGGGGSGGYSRRLLSAAQIGASQPITIGAGGAGGIGNSTLSTSGGDTFMGSSLATALCAAKGGGGARNNAGYEGGAGGPTTGAVGDVVFAGAPGASGSSNPSATGGAPGGSSAYGGGAAGWGIADGSQDGRPGNNYGAGGGGAYTTAVVTKNGGAGSAGVCIVTEFPASAGAVGPQGPAGPTGATGAQGPTGPVGPPTNWTTGDVKMTFKTVADTGWVMMNDGSIGDASSGATTRANADCSNLFILFYGNCADADVPVQTSTGAATTRAAQGTAAAAFAAHCRMVLPKALGRAFAIAGTGAGMTARALGANVGVEEHAQTVSELANHAHVPASGGYFTISLGGNTQTGAGSFGADTYTASTAAYGGGSPMSLMQPTTFLNVMVCL